MNSISSVRAKPLPDRSLDRLALTKCTARLTFISDPSTVAKLQAQLEQFAAQHISGGFFKLSFEKLDLDI